MAPNDIGAAVFFPPAQYLSSLFHAEDLDLPQPGPGSAATAVSTRANRSAMARTVASSNRAAAAGHASAQPARLAPLSRVQARNMSRSNRAAPVPAGMADARTPGSSADAWVPSCRVSMTWNTG